jgi:DNA repair protein RecO (recombination protein O)
MMDTRSRERVYQTEAIVLHRADIGEADRVLTVFTPRRGKVRAVAKGIRRPISKMAGHLELFTHTQLLIAHGRDLDLITQAHAIHTFPGIRGNLWRVAYASYAVELVDRFTEEGDEQSTLFALLLRILQYMDSAQRLDTALYWFELHLLDLLGYRPELRVCVSCGHALEPVVNGFSAASGGVLCPLCRRQTGHQREISVDALKVLRYLQAQDLPEALRVRLEGDLRGEVEGLVEEYLHTLLEHDLASADFLRDLRRRLPPLG